MPGVGMVFPEPAVQLNTAALLSFGVVVEVPVHISVYLIVVLAPGI